MCMRFAEHGIHRKVRTDQTRYAGSTRFSRRFAVCTADWTAMLQPRYMCPQLA